MTFVLVKNVNSEWIRNLTAVPECVANKKVDIFDVFLTVLVCLKADGQTVMTLRAHILIALQLANNLGLFESAEACYWQLSAGQPVPQVLMHSFTMLTLTGIVRKFFAANIPLAWRNVVCSLSWSVCCLSVICYSFFLVSNCYPLHFPPRACGPFPLFAYYRSGCVSSWIVWISNSPGIHYSSLDGNSASWEKW